MSELITGNNAASNPASQNACNPMSFHAVSSCTGRDLAVDQSIIQEVTNCLKDSELVLNFNWPEGLILKKNSDIDINVGDITTNFFLCLKYFRWKGSNLSHGQMEQTGSSIASWCYVIWL
jgi:hypothetical protein